MAQTSNGLAFPSPNNTFLGTAGNIRSATGISVDQHTGTAQVNVPICNLASKGLSIPISISYIGARGIRLQDYAGSVGLGWALNAGGAISRVVRCYPDEQPNGYLGNGTLPSGAIGTGGQWGKLVAGNLAGTTTLTSSQYTAITGINGTSYTTPTADGEPDLFYVNTPFFNFQFSFDENGNPVFSNNSGVKIIANNFNNSYNYSNCSFEVIDPSGNQYYFGSSSASVEVTTTNLFGTACTFPSTWYLDKIVSFNSSDIVNLYYTAGATVDSNYHYTGTATFDAIGNRSYDTTHPVLNKVSSKYVSRIVSLAGEADFTYAFNRSDDVNAAKLTTVALIGYNPYTQSNSATLQTFNFNYSYFGAGSADPNVLRLKLDSISVTGNTSTTSGPLTIKSFGYNTTNIMPSRKMFAVSDYWGYLNYLPAMTYVAFPGNSRNPVLAAASTDVLTTIKDVLGGSWRITYDLNDYYNTSTSSNTTVGGLRVRSLAKTLPTGDSITTNYSYLDNLAHSTGQILSSSYNITAFIASGGNGTIYEYFSESPSEYFDLNGDFFGYSSVKATGANGGYTITNFTNFIDYPDSFNYFSGLSPGSVPDITSSISRVYKRGLVSDMTSYTSAGNKVAEDATPMATCYASLTSPILKKSWGYKWNIISYNIGGSSGYIGCGSSYWTNVENFKEVQAVHYDYDQLTPGNSIQTSSVFSYDTAKVLVDSIYTVDSKGYQVSKRFYHPGDAGIPMTTPGELTAISDMNSPGTNLTSVVIHEIDSRNGSITQQHNSYAVNTVGTATNIDLASSSNYTGSTLASQQFFNYDPSTDNMISTNLTGGKSTAALFGDNKTQPIARVVNASSSASASLQPTTASGDMSFTGNSGQTTFTTFATGNIVLNIDVSPGNTYTVTYNLTGPSSGSGSLCASRSSVTCSYPSTVTFTNVPAGTYTLTGSLSSGSSPYYGISYIYTGSHLVTTTTSEFFYEGFEENNVGTYGTAHTGIMYWNAGTYTVPFTPPNGRTYIIQWWTWSGGKWVLTEQNYTTNMTISGIIDDVRVFPSDAQMTTYTYSPQVGVTSQTDPAGHSRYYQYDGLGRLAVLRDNDGNILNRYCYTYAGQSLACPADPVYTNVVESSTITRNNCPTGYVPGTAVYTVPAGTYSSLISQSDANQQALYDISANGQNYANANATCTQTWYNVVESGSFTRNNCGTGYVGSTVTYTVAANTYSSTISQADANQKAINDVNANGQNYANTNGTCTTTAVQHYGDLSMPGNSASVSFTTTTVGTITLSIDPNPGATYSLNYSLTGPSPKSGTQCASRTSTSCGSVPGSATFPSMPVGTYTLTINLSSGSSASKSMSYTYYTAN